MGGLHVYLLPCGRRPPGPDYIARWEVGEGVWRGQKEGSVIGWRHHGLDFIAFVLPLHTDFLAPTHHQAYDSSHVTHVWSSHPPDTSPDVPGSQQSRDPRGVFRRGQPTAVSRRPGHGCPPVDGGVTAASDVRHRGASGGIGSRCLCCLVHRKYKGGLD